MKGLYFDDSPEPDDFRFEFMKSVREILEEEDDATFVEIRFDNKSDFYKVLNECHNMVTEGFKVSSTSRENTYDIIMEESEDLEEEPKPKPKEKKKKKES